MCITSILDDKSRHARQTNILQVIVAEGLLRQHLNLRLQFQTFATMNVLPGYRLFLTTGNSRPGAEKGRFFPSKASSWGKLFRERPYNFGRNMKEKYRANKRQRKYQNHIWVHSETRRIVRVQLQHRPRGPACSSCTCRVWSCYLTTTSTTTNLSAWRPCYGIALAT